MDFPDMKSITRAAELWKFRSIKEGETEDEYRTALADHVQPRDLVESMEIRAKVGWDKFTEIQNHDLVRRAADNARPQT